MYINISFLIRVYIPFGGSGAGAPDNYHDDPPNMPPPNAAFAAIGS
jgi:hypothetical protein